MSASNMAPLRNNRRSNRSGRTQVDHDIMEGLPVRQWRVQPAVINLMPPKDTIKKDSADDRWKELPMPKGSELYSPMSQALLRAARTGLMNRPIQRPADEYGEEEDDADGDLDSQFVTLKWSQVPKDVDLPEPEFLAKRRKGLPTFQEDALRYAKSSAQMRKVRVRKVDAQGNMTVFDVLAPDGVQVDGEIVDGGVELTEAPAPGTVIEGVGVANAEGVVVIADRQAIPTPQRRRPPPPKRRPKGPGRGRKKKQLPAAAAPASTSHTAGPIPQVQVGDPGSFANAIKLPDDQAQVASNADTEMGEDSIMHDGDDGSDDEDDESIKGDREEVESGDIDTPSKRMSPIKSSDPAPATFLNGAQIAAPHADSVDIISAPKPASPVEIAAKPLLSPALPNPESSLPATDSMNVDSAAQQSSGQGPDDSKLATSLETGTSVQMDTSMSGTQVDEPKPEPLLPHPLATKPVASTDLSSSPDVPLASASLSPTKTKADVAASPPMGSPTATSKSPLKSPTVKPSQRLRRSSSSSKGANFKPLQSAPFSPPGLVNIAPAPSPSDKSVAANAGPSPATHVNMAPPPPPPSLPNPPAPQILSPPKLNPISPGVPPSPATALPPGLMSTQLPLASPPALAPAVSPGPASTLSPTTVEHPPAAPSTLHSPPIDGGASPALEQKDLPLPTEAKDVAVEPDAARTPNAPTHAAESAPDVGDAPATEDPTSSPVLSPRSGRSQGSNKRRKASQS